MSNNMSRDEIAAKVAKLPKWAREYVELLEYQSAKDAEDAAKLRSGAFGPADTDTFLQTFDGRDAVALPKGGSIRFVMGYGSEDEIRVRISSRESQLEVMGLGGIEIIPQAANVVAVRLRGD